MGRKEAREGIKGKRPWRPTASALNSGRTLDPTIAAEVKEFIKKNNPKNLGSKAKIRADKIKASSET